MVLILPIGINKKVRNGWLKVYFNRRKIKNSVNILKIKENNKYTDNKEWMIIPNAVHTDLYDGKDIFPFDKIESFYKEYLK